MAGARLAHEATIAWITSFVAGLKLCPWAVTSASLVVVAPCLDAHDDALVAYVRRQAMLLASNRHPHAQAQAPTTLCVYTDERFGEVGRFAELWVAVEQDLAAVARNGGPRFVLLAFHPTRIDGGIGCRPEDPDDPGHYTVRAPWPTLQLLRAEDVDAARHSWATQHGGPGALGLLTRNKAHLRSLGTDELRRRLNACKGE